ncbi:hypothetical protein Efla_005748 [Eimeria flavescens]
MAFLKLLSVAAVSALHLAVASEPSSSTTTRASLGQSVCMAQLNTARADAGLPAFSSFPPDGGLAALAKERDLGENAILKPVCTSLLKGETAPQVAASADFSSLKGLPALLPLAGSNPDCSKSIQTFKAGYANFGSVPPEYSEATKELYANPASLAFLSVFNPGAEPKADCRVISCSQETTTNDQEKLPGNQTNGTATLERTAHALLCLTSPNVLQEGMAPFTLEQWAQLATAFKASSAPSLPHTLVAFAAAVVGSLLL